RRRSSPACPPARRRPSPTRSRSAGRSAWPKSSTRRSSSSPPRVAWPTRARSCWAARGTTLSNFWAAESGSDIASIPVAGVARIESSGFRSLYTAPPGAQTQAMRMAAYADAEPEGDPLEQARIEAFAQGFDEGCRVTEEGMASDAEARSRLAEALEMLTPAPSGTLATMLSATVIRLVSQIVGEVAIDAELLQQRCETIAGFIDEN